MFIATISVSTIAVYNVGIETGFNVISVKKILNYGLSGTLWSIVNIYFFILNLCLHVNKIHNIFVSQRS